MCFVFSCFTFFVFYILCREQDPATTILVSHLGLLGAHYKDLEHASPLKQSLHIRYIETIYGYLTSIYIYIYTSQMLVHWYGPNKIIDPLITQVNMWSEDSLPIMKTKDWTPQRPLFSHASEFSSLDACRERATHEESHALNVYISTFFKASVLSPLLAHSMKPYTT